MYLRTVLILAIAAVSVEALTSPNASVQRTIAGSSLQMSPRFDPSTEKWYPTTPEDEEGYGPLGTLLRSGPKPFFIRLAGFDSYEQGVYKFMNNEKMSRIEAQANFDAYLENPNDWAYQYLQEKKGGFKKDYVNDGMDISSLALKGIWTALLFGLAARGVYCYNTGEYFYDFLRQH